MKRFKRIAIVAAAVVGIAGSAIAFSDEGSRRFGEFLNGLKEAPAIVSTTVTGTFRAVINDDETEIRYLLSTPACNVDNPLDLRNGRVTGTLTAAEVQTLAANGIAAPTATTPGEFAEVVALVRAGATYMNVHSAKFGAGEIRSQIANRNDHDHRNH